MSARFPIANAIRSGASLALNDLKVGPPAPDLKRVIADAVLFDFSIPSELYWTGKQDYYELGHDFGPVRPPFPVMWCEWKIPERVMIEGRWVEGSHHFANKNFGAMIHAFEQDSSVCVIAQQFVLNPGLDRVFALLPRMLRINEAGHYIPGTVKTIYGEGDDIDEVRLVDKIDQNVVWLGLTLINCRNVTTRETGCVYPRSGTEKRRQVPVTKYRTIVLPGSGGGGSRRGSRDVMALHRVRGHFKTYTPDAPLMGKHTGTYWWGWQVRGKKENGEIVSDYRLECHA